MHISLRVLYLGGSERSSVQNFIQYQDLVFGVRRGHQSKILSSIRIWFFFSKVQLQTQIFLDFALRKLGEVSINPKFYIVLGFGHNSIPQKQDLFRWTYAYMYAYEDDISALLSKYTPHLRQIFFQLVNRIFGYSPDKMAPADSLPSKITKRSNQQRVY